MARVLYVYSLRNTFTRIDREALAERYEVEEYFQPGARPRLRELRREAAPLRRRLRLVRLLAHARGADAGAADAGALGADHRRLRHRQRSRDRLRQPAGPDPRRWRARLAIRSADRLITNSDYLEGEIERNLGIPPERVTGRPPRPRRPLRRRGAARCRERRWRSRSPSSTAGTSSARACGPFVEAAASHPEVEFVVAGKWEDDAIDVLRASSPARTSPSPASSPTRTSTREFRRAHVYVQASWHEGFGLSLAEAMLAGRRPGRRPRRARCPRWSATPASRSRRRGRRTSPPASARRWSSGRRRACARASACLERVPARQARRRASAPRSRRRSREGLGRLHRRRAPAGPAADHRAPRRRRPRGRGHRPRLRPDRRAARAARDPAHGRRPPRRRLDRRQGDRARAPQRRARALGAAAALRPRARPRLGRHRGRLDAAADPAGADAGLRARRPAAPARLPRRPPGARARRDPGRGDAAGRRRAGEAVSLPRA